ncbi:tRNA glutamyl-Q(34) synthetase GluQRS [Algirhabdus cladophorae]|uniref:tRNA glutamyl-Q(34) synthetase GluQRS n=1 Tax=Algirhabdus cladophorae TaxID=3377108 RepID=UPI003B847575
MTFRTRFAPSPTGPLHLGHAYSAWLGWTMAQQARGEFLLRIEDIDRQRSKPTWEDRIYADLEWLGLTWAEAVLRQSSRISAYRSALQQLWDLGVLYPCTCNRRDIQEALGAPQEGSPLPVGPDGLVYPGTCRTKPRPSQMSDNSVLRLDMARALQVCTSLAFVETGLFDQTIRLSHDDLINTVGDIVLARRDMGTSYHLSVVLDDAHQNINHVVRGADLFEATAIHVVLQNLLILPTPIYHHHALVRDNAGKRLAKRDDARAIATYRDQGLTAEQVIALSQP